MTAARPEVVIVVAVSAASTALKAPVHITIVDRRNHNLFQPLLYQVATAALNPVDNRRERLPRAHGRLGQHLVRYVLPPP